MENQPLIFNAQAIVFAILQGQANVQRNDILLHHANTSASVAGAWSKR